MQIHNYRRLCFLGYFILLVPFSIYVKMYTAEEQYALNNIMEGDKLESFSARSFELSDHNNEPQEIKLEDAIKGNNYTLVQFWATWCTQCRFELPRLEKLYKEHKQEKFEILAITVQSPHDKIEKYIKDTNITFPILLDEENKLMSKFKLNALPSGILLDREGKVVRVFRGKNLWLEKFLKEVSKL